MEALISNLVGRVTGCLIQPVEREVGYLLHYKSNITSLDNEFKSLQTITSGVQMKVEAARRNSLVILPSVEAWLTSVVTATEDVRSVQGDIAEFEGCFYGLCPNLKSRYLLSRRAKEITLVVIELLNKGRDYEGRAYADISNPMPPGQVGVIPDESGEELESRKLKEEEVMAALRDESTTVIGICGMGGVGKTTLVEKIRERVKREGSLDEVVMATVSQKPDLKRIQGEIAGGIGLTLQGDNLWGRGDQLRSRLMGPKSVFVILDDVWEAIDLKNLGIPSGSSENNRCKVTFTTRRRDVCETMEAQKIVEVGILTEKEAWILFRQKTGNSVDNPSLLHIAEDVAKECKGLPLAIITVAGALKRKGKPSWEDALLQLRGAAPRDIPGVHENVYKPLKLSYDHLESDKARYLFLLCSLFEEDSDIFPEDLLRYGMGLGIFLEIESLEGARNRVCHLLETLKDYSLLSQGSGKNYVKMHDVVRDVAISIASKGKHAFMVSHDKNLEEFPRRTSYEQYTHISIVAKRFAELPQPISCPRLELLMLRFCEEGSIVLQDNFFIGMNELNVLSVRGIKYLITTSVSFQRSILPFPASVRQLSNLKTLLLSHLRLGNISVIGEFVNLEILSIRDSHLEVFPVEIGKLTNLIMLELRIVHGSLKSIPPGILSRLVWLEELHLDGVKCISYSTLRELESLSKLTALTLGSCATDVIYSNLSISSELARYTLRVGEAFVYLFEDYERAMDLEVTESIPLDDWICDMLRKSERVRSSGNGSNSVLTELLRDGFQNVKYLHLDRFGSVIHLLEIHSQNNIPFPILERLDVRYSDSLQYLFCVSKHEKEEMVQVIKFPNLYNLNLSFLKCLAHFCNDTIEGIEFPQLRTMSFDCLNLFENFWPKANSGILEGSSITHSNPLFDEKVFCPSLETLELQKVDGITALCSHQLPAGYFSILKELFIGDCGKLRNLMPPSVAKGLVNIQDLKISSCLSMEEVITEEDIMTKESLFPRLETLLLYDLPKLGHFFLTRSALEFPSLQEVYIYECPEMKTFVLGPVSTPSLCFLAVGKEIEDAEVKDGLNKAIQHMFNSKVQQSTDGDEFEACD